MPAPSLWLAYIPVCLVGPGPVPGPLSTTVQGGWVAWELTWTPHDGDSTCEGRAPGVTSLCLSVRAVGGHFLQFPEGCCREGAVRPPQNHQGPWPPSVQDGPVRSPLFPELPPGHLRAVLGAPWLSILSTTWAGALGRDSRQSGQCCRGRWGSLTLTWRDVWKHLSWGAWSQEGSISLIG